MSTLIEHIQRRIANRPKGVSMREIGRRASVGEASVRRLRAGKPVTMPVYERVSAALDAIENDAPAGGHNDGPSSGSPSSLGEPHQ